LVSRGILEPSPADLEVDYVPLVDLKFPEDKSQEIFWLSILYHTDRSSVDKSKNKWDYIKLRNYCKKSKEAIKNKRTICIMGEYICQLFI
jgi:hypothetical protein